MRRLEILHFIRHSKLDRRKIVILLMVILIGTIAYMSIGASRTDNFNAKEDEVDIQERPGEFSLPNQNGTGYNLTGDFTNFPTLDPPSEFFDSDLFNPDDWGGGFNFSDPVFSGEFPEFSFPSAGFPTVSLPGWEPPTFSPGTGPNPTLPGQTDIPTPSVDQNGSNGFDFTLPDRENKARNLPKIDIFSNFSLNINILNVDLDINLTKEGIVFVFLLVSLLYINKKLLPDLIYKLEHEDEEENKTSEFFIRAPKIDEEAIKKKERLKKLVRFKDHIDEIVLRSYVRIDEEGPSETIVQGYHDLDDAFASFSKLQRTRDITPLEHAKHQFETGEIDNARLEEIVDLFYMTRFGRRKMIKSDAMAFIDHLINLVTKHEEIDRDEI